MISHPFGSVMRSLLIAIYELGVTEILVVGHTDCGVLHADANGLVAKMKKRGITQVKIETVEYFGVAMAKWLGGFNDLDASVATIVKHPLVPGDVKVYGFVMDSITGEMTKIV